MNALNTGDKPLLGLSLTHHKHYIGKLLKFRSYLKLHSTAEDVVYWLDCDEKKLKEITIYFISMYYTEKEKRLTSGNTKKVLPNGLPEDLENLIYSFIPKPMNHQMYKPWKVGYYYVIPKTQREIGYWTGDLASGDRERDAKTQPHRNEILHIQRMTNHNMWFVWIGVDGQCSTVQRQRIQGGIVGNYPPYTTKDVIDLSDTHNNPDTPCIEWAEKWVH